ncbi:MAG: class I SAM-dependent RNA methyltransferase [Bryobacteraceae bacterium]
MRFEKLVFGGEALARVDGRVVLAPYALPGELSRIHAISEKPGLVRARVEATIEPSPHRVEPGCPHFGRCGGCHYQHADAAYQGAQKLAILREVLKRTGHVDAPDGLGYVSGPAWEYRNRVQLHFDGGSPGMMGYHEAGSHRLVGIEQCPVASPRLNHSMASLRTMMADRRWPRFLRGMELFTNEEQVQVNVLDSGTRHLSHAFFEWCAEAMPGALSSALEYPAGGDVFRVSHKSFFQVNRFLLDQLVETATGGVSGDRALDLYAGVGLFSIPLARRFGETVAVEAVASAVIDLEHNASRAGVRLSAVREGVERYLERVEEAPDFVLADPPRAGLGRAVTAALNRLKPERVVIVSCDPATLARDLAELTGTGGFRIEAMTLVDLFPQTAHIETVTRLAPGH